MQSNSGNDVKQYNLTAGKSLPEWLDERKRRTLLKRDVELRRRLELLQEFDMPSVSSNIRISNDGDYILATGTYKPRVKCFDVNQLGLKFERCFDSEPVAFSILSDDYSKVAFLQCDRYVELHAQFGRYYRLRVPKFGRDLAYHPSSCDLYVVGAGCDIHRLNLEQGRFLNPLTTQALGVNVCKVNQDHHLFTCGTTDGQVEAWDPRSRQKSATLDCALPLLQGDHLENDQIPQITSLAYRDGLNLAVGTSTGHILLYDIRSSRPLLVKDHLYGTPIKSLIFHSTQDQVISLDAKAVKIWDRLTGQPYTSIESEAELNEVVAYEGSGLIFMSNEQPKMQVHYIPTLGPAPKWCSFLDNITEEIEENAVSAIYDDYKFITKDELTDLGLDHLVGSSLLRAYMHGYFMDARLYRKAHSIAQPYKDGLKDKIDKKIAEERTKRVEIKSNLPKINKDLFLKLNDHASGGTKKKKSREAAATLLADPRFSSVFTDEQFQVDKNDEAYRLLNPVLTKLDAEKTKDLEKRFSSLDNDAPNNSDSEMEDDNDGMSDDFEDESSDDDHVWTQKVKEEHKKLREEAAIQRRAAQQEKTFKKISDMSKAKKPKFVELDDSSEMKRKHKKSKSIAEQLAQDPELMERKDGHQMTFHTKKSFKKLEEEKQNKQHRKDRLGIARSAKLIKKDPIKTLRRDKRQK